MAFRAALIGCGFFARNHLSAWHDIAGVEVVAVCDRDAAKARALAERFGIPRIHTDAAELLAEEHLDFVDIVTTVESHRALVGLCAANGIPVICQKPFARDLTEGRAMVADCARACVPLMVHENFRWQAAMLAMKAALDGGAIGDIETGRISFRHGYDIYSGQPYLLTEERLAIMDIGIHVLDLARYFLGEVDRLACYAQRIDPRVRGEDAVSILLDHANGSSSFVDFCFATKLDPDPFPQTLLRFEGSKGHVALEAGYRLVVNGETRRVEPPVPGWGEKPWHVIQDSVVAIQRHWVECLREGTEPATSGADNLRTLQLVELAYLSAAEGRALSSRMSA